MVELFHHHSPRRDDREAPLAATEPGDKSLADALRVSFRLLSAIMLVVLFFYMLTGVKSVESSQVGLKKVFGRVVSVVQPGLAYTWPFPIGSIDLISTREQELSVNDFWMFETPEQKAAGDLLSREMVPLDLDPARDGALLTGDRNLLHVRLSCKYVVVDPLAYLSHIGDDPSRLREVVRSAVCHAAIRAAAFQTADGLQRTERAVFTAAVRREAQAELDALGSGLELRSVLLTDSTWPLGALKAYIDAQNAVSRAEQARNAARAEAERELNAAAGAGYRRLVGDVGGFAPTSQEAADKEANLIGQYAAAVAAGDPAAAADLLTKIDDVLRSNETGGQAARIIAEAEAYRTTTLQRVKGRVERFRELLPAYEKTPDLMLQRLWIDVRQAILDAPTNEKFYLTFGPNKTVLRINRDPKIVAEIERALKAKDQKDRQK
ncbi:MAG: SPFH domain-containing protein [Phycisphaerae bacterium]|nr:SPFH domain-containing protein [Phycisphaerae bacterium]